MQKLHELPFELAHFQAEELEERLENKWKADVDDCESFIRAENYPAPVGPTVECGVKIPIN